MNQFCFVISGPSGVGKTTLVNALLSSFEELEISVSYTTRSLRGTEVDGQHYHFIDDGRFDEMVKEDAFAEWAQVHTNRYGTTRETIKRIWASQKNVLFDIDYQGEEQLKKAFGKRTISVLVLPPSLQELEHRLRGRGTEDEATIQRRMRNAENEISHFENFDFILMNDDLEDAQEKVKMLYVATKNAVRFWSDRVLALLGAEKVADSWEDQVDLLLGSENSAKKSE